MVESLVLQLENVVISFLLCLCFDLHRWCLVMDKQLHHLTVSITDCFIRKRHTKMIPSTFVVLFCVSNWFLSLLVLGSLDRTTVISLIGFTEHKSSADHNGWQPRCKWTSQIWNVAHCLEHWTVANAPTHTIFCNFLENWYVTIPELTNCWYSPLSRCDSSLKKNSINFCPGVCNSNQHTLWLTTKCHFAREQVTFQYSGMGLQVHNLTLTGKIN